MTRYRHLITDDNSKWWTLGAMCFALFMMMLDNTVVNVALPSIQRTSAPASPASSGRSTRTPSASAFCSSPAGASATSSAGARRSSPASPIFALSSATAGLAQDTTMLIVSRIVQGVGGALMMPATLSIVTNAFEPSERGKAIGTWAGVSALALAIGPVVGGLLTEHVSWRAIFYLNIPVAAGAIAATIFAVRESRDDSVGREIDYLGVGALTVGLTSLVLALIEANSWGWGSARIVGLFALSIVALVELRLHRAPRPGADRRAAAVRESQLRRHERGRARRDLRDDGPVLLRHALHPGRARLLARRDRAALPAVDADDRPDRADRRAHDRPRRRRAG